MAAWRLSGTDEKGTRYVFVSSEFRKIMAMMDVVDWVDVTITRC